MGRHYKYYLPQWAKEAALAFVQGRDEMAARLRRKENDVLWSSQGSGAAVHTGPGDPTARKAVQMAALWDSPDGRIVRAVDAALLAAADGDVCLAKALKISCATGAPYVCGMDGVFVSRSNFYRRRKKALWLIALATGLMEG